MRKQNMDGDIVGAHDSAEEEVWNIAKQSEGGSQRTFGLITGTEDGCLEVHIGSHVLTHLGSGLVPHPLSSHGQRAGKTKKAVNVKSNARGDFSSLFGV